MQLPFLLGVLMLAPIPMVYGQENLDQLFSDAESLFLQRKYDDSMTVVKKMLEIDPNHVKANWLAGKINHRQGNYDAALSYYDKALMQEPSNYLIRGDKGNLLVRLGNYDAGEKLLFDSLERFPAQLKTEHIDTLQGIANIYSHRGDYENDLHYRNKVLEIEPDNVEAIIGIGNVYTEGFLEFQKGLEFYDKALKIEPNNINAIIGKGNAYLGLKMYDEALDSYEKALELDPDNRNALNGRSNVVVDMMNDMPRANVEPEFSLKSKDYYLITGFVLGAIIVSAYYLTNRNALTKPRK